MDKPRSRWRRSERMVRRERSILWPWLPEWTHVRGPDAPLSPRWRRIYRLVVACIVIVGVGLVTWAAISN